MKSKYSPLFIMFMLITSLACAIPGLNRNDSAAPAGSQPRVTLTSPAAGQKLTLGQEIKVQSTSLDPTSGITRVELALDNQVIWVDANPQPQPNTPYVVAQAWTPNTPGAHIIQARAYNQANVAGQSAPLIVEVASAQTVNDAAMPTTTPTFTTARPTSTSPLPPAVTSPPPAPVCTPPPCRQGEVYYCPDDCPGGCGTTCATVTPQAPPPTSTPTPGQFASTGFKPEGRFKEIWLEVGGGNSRLGYPTGPAIIGRNYARQYFERGLMFWWDNPDGPAYIWAIDSPAADLRSGQSSNRYMDTWGGGDEYTCDAARRNGDKGPKRGFGKVWCEHPEWQKRLGNPHEGEAGSGDHPPFAQVQFFQGGVMLYNPLNVEVLVLFNQGDWQRFGW